MKRLYAVLVLLLVIPCSGTTQTLKQMNKPMVRGLDEVAPFSEGLAAVRKGNQWGFINKEGKLVIDFRDDLVWNKNADTDLYGVAAIKYPRFKNGLCVVKELKEENIPYYGFIDTTGKRVIEADYLNVTEFDQNYAVGIYCKKTFRGQNEFQLNIYDYSFTEVVINTDGEITWPIGERENILMSQRRYELPELNAKLISDNLLAVKTKDQNWEVRKLSL